MDFSDAHTFNLASQGSIYTQTVIQLVDGSSKLIVATLNRKVFCFDLSMTHCARPCGCVVVPQTQELQFTYIPGGSEIISIHAYNRSTTTNDFVIGITIIKCAENGSPGQYLNIYSDWEPGAQLELDSLANSCLSLELDYIPYQLSHCQLGEETVWLLGGSDAKVHIFRENMLSHMFTEWNSGDLMPEFSQPLPSVPLHTSVHNDDVFRTTAVCCECGHLRVSRVNHQTRELLNVWERNFDGPLTTALLFRSDTHAESRLLPPFIQLAEVQKPQPPHHGLHLLLTYSLGPSLVFSDVQEYGLEKSERLPGSDRYDVVTCAWTADLRQDGGPPVLLLGTFGQELLAYCQAAGDTDRRWQLLWQRTFASPVLGVRYADLTGDGVRELIVITTRGVQVLQHNLSQVKDRALRALKQLVSSLRS